MVDKVMNLHFNFSDLSRLEYDSRIFIIERINSLSKIPCCLSRGKKIIFNKRMMGVNIHLLGDSEIKYLNKKWRKKNKTTDVLSFSYCEKQLNMENIMGDIIISLKVAQYQSKKFNHSLAEEIVVLFIHGLTHLFGYDHEKSTAESDIQKKAEIYLLDKINMDSKLALCGR